MEEILYGMDIFTVIQLSYRVNTNNILPINY